ncbi:hypothetical protein F7731_08575 [Cytobacillus depressus]|uniref:Uncharacterized protein n=1 Tax=Cytobacillus depressus TaxID=1602942 RepID=A0A6L3VAS3_9BACI|nr:hypothetical protein [Cytobacillus depressus]KAB2337639.1 hypothetical protein F7731_08575 [Cytobacillus depressus]
MEILEKIENILDELELKYKKDNEDPAFIVGFELEKGKFKLVIFVDENLERISFMFHINKKIKDIETAKELIFLENSNHVVYGSVGIFENSDILMYQNNVSIVNRTIDVGEFNDYIMYSNYLFEKLYNWQVFE